MPGFSKLLRTATKLRHRLFHMQRQRIGLLPPKRRGACDLPLAAPNHIEKKSVEMLATSVVLKHCNELRNRNSKCFEPFAQVQDMALRSISLEH